MAETNDPRIDSLERRVRNLTRALFGFGIALVVLVVSGMAWQSQSDVVRTGALIILDKEGNERIVIGAPVPEPEGVRIAPHTGMVIRDPDGAERFGVGLFPDGTMNMGFDAPPENGDDRNRERITITAKSNGGSEIRFLDRNTLVRAHMSLFDDNNVYLFMTDYRDGQTVVSKTWAGGDTVFVHEK